MLAAFDFALSVRRILRRIFDRHLRQLQSDDCELASSELMRWLVFSFIDPAGMLGFLLLTSPERVDFLFVR